MLFGRIAPYFITHSELNDLLKIKTPSEDNVLQLRKILLRSTQRKYFFNHLSSPRWLPLLAEHDLFTSPPDRELFDDGSWRPRPWPEGEYLVRIAGSDPDGVLKQLVAIPGSNTNPLVWRHVIDAGTKMPGEYASKLVPLVNNAMKSSYPRLFGHRAIDLVKHLASEGESSSFTLAEHLLHMIRIPSKEEDNVQNGISPSIIDSHNEEWMLVRIDAHELSEFLNKAMPQLARFDPIDTLVLLAKRLDRAVNLYSVLSSDKPQRSGKSRRWCSSLTNTDIRDGVRAQLATAVTSIACNFAEVSADSARRVWTILSDFPHEIFERIRLLVLSKTGPSLQEELNQIIGGESLLDPDCGAQEVAIVLREQFSNASPEARRIFSYSLRRGPQPSELIASIEWAQSFRDSEETIEQLEERIKAEWISRRLRWFHDQIPEELRDLANSLDVESLVPSPRQQSMDEVGYYVGGATWAGDTSPKSEAELQSMETDELINFLNEWEPEKDSWDGPSHEGGTCQQK